MNRTIQTMLIIIVQAFVLLVVGCGGEKPPERFKVAIFNLMSHPILDASASGIKAALRENGLDERNLEIIEVSANGEMDKLNAFAKEVLATRPDVVVPISTPVTAAVFKEAPQNQKIVFSTVTNPSDVGMDGLPPNMTGVCDAVNYEANLDLISELFPNARRIGIIYNAGERNSQYGVDQVRSLAESRHMQLVVVPVSNSQEVMDAVASLVGNIDVIYVGSDNTVVSSMVGLTKEAYRNRLPVIASDVGSMEQGALAAVSVDYEKLGRKAGEIVAEAVKTHKLPQPTSPVFFKGDQLIISEIAAKKIGYTFPSSVQQRANRTIR